MKSASIGRGYSFAKPIRYDMIQSSIHKSEEAKALSVTSEAFEDRTYISPKYTCDGLNINPPLHISNIPPETKSLAIIVEDTDSPTGIWTHWIVWNISPIGQINENTVPGSEGINDFRKQHYGGPCPPSGTHHYHFKVYALDELLDLKPDTEKREIEKAISSHMLAFGELVGLYKRSFS